ncbi:MAG: hypothetical protein C5B49_16460 [Bdellovibrio sp.]|nr:MAG: hypothetical protein C5B49_16460 [Bdellovibrio sp.]
MVLFPKLKRYQALMRLLIVDELAGSVRQLSLLSCLPYATTYAYLHELKKQGLVKSVLIGRTAVFSLAISRSEQEELQYRLGLPTVPARALSEFPEVEVLPLVGDFPELQIEKANTKEEMLVRALTLSKNNPVLLRTLPLLTEKLGAMGTDLLNYWASKLKVKQELGFLLDLTAELSKKKKLSGLARRLKDKRRRRDSFFFEKENDLKGFEAKLVERNTPALARKWHLKLNMSLDVFESTYNKFSNTL